MRNKEYYDDLQNEVIRDVIHPFAERHEKRLHNHVNNETIELNNTANDTR